MSELDLSFTIDDKQKMKFALEEINPIVTSMVKALEKELGGGSRASIEASVAVNKIIATAFDPHGDFNITARSVEEIGVFTEDLKKFSKEVIKHPRIWCDWFRVNNRLQTVRGSFESQLRLLR